MTFANSATQNGYDWIFINYRGMGVKMTNGIPANASDVDSFKEPIRTIIKHHSS